MKLNPLADRLHQLSPAEPTSSGTLRIVPFIGESATEPLYRLLGDDTEEGVEITEIDEEGSVPELRIRNDLDVPILLIGGQGLIGLKQDRMVNTDILVPAGSEIEIPVSCIEVGRWRPRSPRAERGRVSPSSIRSGAAADVTENLVAGRGHRSDQGEVWSDVERIAMCSPRPSPTGAMHEIYEQLDGDFKSIREQLTLPGGTVGIAVFDGQRLLGLDLFDRASTMTAFWETLVDSYAMEWLARRNVQITMDLSSTVAADMLLEHVAGADWMKHETPGLGADFRLQDEQLSGSVLVWEKTSMVHLQAFPRPQERGRRGRPEQRSDGD